MSKNKQGNGAVTPTIKQTTPDLDLDFGPKTREFKGFLAVIVSLIAIAASLFHLYTA